MKRNNPGIANFEKNSNLTSNIGMEESWFMASSTTESFPFLVALMLARPLNAALIEFMAV